MPELTGNSGSLTAGKDILRPSPGEYKKNPPVELQGEIDDVYIPDKASSWKTEFGT